MEIRKSQNDVSYANLHSLKVVYRGQNLKVQGAALVVIDKGLIPRNYKEIELGALLY